MFFVLIIVHHLILIIAKIFFFILGEGPTFGIKALVHEKKKIITFRKENTKCCLSLHYNAGNNYLLMEKKYLNLKPTIKIITFQSNFVSQV